jgi:hypothetical protein
MVAPPRLLLLVGEILSCTHTVLGVGQSDGLTSCMSCNELYAFLYVHCFEWTVCMNAALSRVSRWDIGGALRNQRACHRPRPIPRIVSNSDYGSCSPSTIA